VAEHRTTAGPDPLPTAATVPHRATARRTPGRFDAVPLALAAGAAFWLLAPGTLHPESLAVLGAPGALDAPAAAEPLAVALRAAVRWLGTTFGVDLRFEAHLVRAVAAAAAAAALLFVHGTARTLVARGHALVAAALAIACPAVAIAATAVHVHAVVLLLAAVATSGALATAQRPTWWRGLLLGGWLAGAHALTPGAALTAAVVLPWACCAHPPPPGTRRRAAFVGLLVLATWLGATLLLQRGDVTRGLPSREQIAAFDLGTLAPLLLRDVGRDLLPLSWVLLACLWSKHHHRAALCLLAATAALLVVGCHRTETLGDDGSWALLLVPPAALLTAQATGPRLGLGLLAATLAVSGTKLWLRSEHAACTAFLTGLRAVAAEGACTIVCGPARDEAFLRAGWPELAAVRIAAVCSPHDERAPAAVVAEFAGMVRDGRQLLLTAEAEAALRDPAWRARHAKAAPLLRELEQAFRFEFVAQGGCHLQRLVPR
jgi:hypothetical protein